MTHHSLFSNQYLSHMKLLSVFCKIRPWKMSNNFHNCSHAGAYMTTQGPVNHKHWHPNNKPQTSHLFRPPTSLLHPLALAYVTKHMHYSEMSCHAPVYCDVLLGKQSQHMSHSEKKCHRKHLLLYTIMWYVDWDTIKVQCCTIIRWSIYFLFTIEIP